MLHLLRRTRATVRLYRTMHPTELLLLHIAANVVRACMLRPYFQNCMFTKPMLQNVSAAGCLMFILGMTCGAVANFPNGIYPTDSCVARVITPKVVEVAQKYFDCPSLPGAELENQNPNCQLVGSHWEQRVFNTEVQQCCISREIYRHVDMFMLPSTCSSWHRTLLMLSVYLPLRSHCTKIQAGIRPTIPLLTRICRNRTTASNRCGLLVVPTRSGRSFH